MPTPYKIKVDLIDENGNPSAKELILHEDNEGADIKGRLITKSAFKKFLKDFYEPSGQPPPDDHDFGGIRFNRHILELALAFPGCESIAFLRAKRNDIFTIVTVLMDSDKNPIGFSSGDPRSFVSIEWGATLSVGDIKSTFPPNAFDDDNLKRIFSSL